MKCMRTIYAKDTSDLIILRRKSVSDLILSESTTIWLDASLFIGSSRREVLYDRPAA
jgi:hypothetical protein